jgi:hypothetical protein
MEAVRNAEAGSIDTRGANDRMGTTWQLVPGFGTIWQARRSVQRVPLRSVAVRLADGGVAVYSPLPRLSARKRSRTWRPSAVPRSTLIPCHGEILHDRNLPARLQRLADTRL